MRRVALLQSLVPIVPGGDFRYRLPPFRREDGRDTGSAKWFDSIPGAVCAQHLVPSTQYPVSTVLGTMLREQVDRIAGTITNVKAALDTPSLRRCEKEQPWLVGVR